MKILSLLLSLILGTPQATYPAPGPGRQAYACAAPAGLVGRWTPTSGCSTSTPCATDQVAGNNASQTTSGDLPTYGATCGPNSTPCLTFNGTTDALLLATPIPSGLTALTMYAVIYVTAAQNNAIFGATNNGGLTYRINGSSNPDLEQLAVQGNSGTQTLSLNTWYTEVVTYNGGTTTTSFYYASGGTLNAAGAPGGPAFSWSTTTTYLGNDQFGEPFAGKIAEWGYLNSVNTTGIAPWSQCHYGV